VRARVLFPVLVYVCGGHGSRADTSTRAGASPIGCS